MGSERYTLSSDNREWKKVAAGAAAGALIGSLLTAVWQENRDHSNKTPNKPATACLAIKALTVPEVVNDDPGNFVARNVGQCVEVHNPDTLKTVGSLLAGEAYNIVCLDGPKPASLRIEAATRKLTGDVQMSEDFVKKLDEKPFSSIPECPYPAA